MSVCFAEQPAWRFSHLNWSNTTALTQVMHHENGEERTKFLDSICCYFYVFNEPWSIRATVSILRLEKQSWREHIKYTPMGPEDCFGPNSSDGAHVRNWPAVKWNDKGPMSGTELRGGTNCFVAAWFTPWPLSVPVFWGLFQTSPWHRRSQPACEIWRQGASFHLDHSNWALGGPLGTKSQVVAAEIWPLALGKLKSESVVRSQLACT